MFPYTIDMINRTLFSNKVIGDILPANQWTSEYLEWVEENKGRRRALRKNYNYEVIQGTSVVQGRLFGGCMEVLETAKGTDIWPEKKHWENAILFFETSEEKSEPKLIKYWLRKIGRAHV